MFRRTFKIVYRPVKSNFLLLPDAYYSVVSTYDHGCLNMQFATSVYYASWAPHSGNLKDTEIGINARVAKEIGLNENDVVKCYLIAEVIHLKSVHVTPISAKDWEIIDLSSEKLAGTILDQTRIINSNQMLIIWINKSMQVNLTVDRVKPSRAYGRIDHHTQLIVSPNFFKNMPNGTIPNGTVNANTQNTVAVNEEKRPTNHIARSQTTAHVHGDTILARSSTLGYVKQRADAPAKVSRQEKIRQLRKELNRESVRAFEFRVIAGPWREKAQISDLFLNIRNWREGIENDSIFCLRTPTDQEYYVRARPLEDDTELPQTIHASIEVNINLMKMLSLKELEKIVLRPKPIVVNFLEKIELFAHRKTHYKIVENAFKRYVAERTARGPMLINQNEIMHLEDGIVVTVGILPEHFRYCVIDVSILKESKIYAADVVRKVDDVVDVVANLESPLSVKDLIKLPQFDEIVEKHAEELKTNLCLDERNSVLKQGNILIAGAAGSGKTVLVERILDNTIRKPFYCFYDIFFCSRNKGRKIESIQKDLRSVFTTCLQNAPGIVVLENLDVLAHTAGDQPTQDGEYFNRIADSVHQLIVQYTSSNPIAVIATVSDLQTLNKRLYSPRGRHLFQSVTKLPNLESVDRVLILEELCCHILTDRLDLTKFANLTEGYNKGNLVQFVERAIFYAYRKNKRNPVLTNDHLIESLENTNSYCLQGIESHHTLDDLDENKELSVEEVPGLETVVGVLEEVIMWPSRYPTIFNLSPLRNQAGVLLYGPPGTGKTFLVSKIASSWNLRTISVKGPELLAKYIGQSEENVRNLFNRARSAKPCVLFFDEFDSLAPKRGHDSTGVTDRVVNQLLTELDGVEDLQGVTVIAATSRPELLDPALLRSGRIDRLVECPLPNALARVRIFEALSSSLNLDDNVDFDSLAAKTQNYTGADIQSILTSANMSAVKEALAAFGHENLPAEIVIKQKHLIDSFLTTRPSLSPADVVKYQKTYARFTNKEKSGSRDYVAKRATLA